MKFFVRLDCLKGESIKIPFDFENLCSYLFWKIFFHGFPFYYFLNLSKTFAKLTVTEHFSSSNV